MNQKTMKVGIAVACLLVAGVVLAWQSGVFGGRSPAPGGVSNTGRISDAATMSESEIKALEDEGATNAGAHKGKPDRVHR